MGSPLDDFVESLQEKILEETRQAYGEKVLERWMNPRFMGRLSSPDGHARIKGVCGDSMEMFLSFNNERVSAASFMTDGCGSTTACGSVAAEMAIGKNPEELLEITGEAIEESLGGLPKAERHCALLAATALQEALHEYMIRRTGKTEDRG
ncbi:MAG: iron-sulfur cluster assembly scaffold protein [Desulfobacteraceae bacterium]|jgi:nitrogen fixation NifU-like protein|nr:MAG: iron-sulfur cluster assembly scaffold protein [Desulfobacteraceae bacterium]